ncbi:calmodulin-like 3 [Mortierella antarctica]|nr:calmodulin-like 3 [Mortierella alpina]KAF9986844.1 calmodulin-like 3 [Mortierella antarctica]
MQQTQFTESQIVNIKQQFNSIDKDLDGYITEKEFLEALKNANRRPEDYDSQGFFSRADKNRDGKITFNEFLDACHELGLGKAAPATGQPTKKSQQEIDNIFNQFDLDGNGFISAKELGQVLAKQGEQLTKEELKEMIRAADLNGDNQIDREEFARMI